MSTLDFVIAGFIFLAIVCIFLIRYYSGAFVTKDVVLSVYLSWVLGLAGILLLPYDISVTLVEQIHSKILDDVWKFVYWSTFILAWLVLPIQMEYHNSGHFAVTEKLFDAIWHNILMGSLAAVAATVYIIYMVSTTGGSFSEVIGFMMAMGNTYGVLLIIFLMGNGLGALPRRLWQMGDDNEELIRLYISVNGIESAYQEARYALEDCEHDVQEAVESTVDVTHIDPKIVAYIDQLQEKVANFHFTGRSTSRQHLLKSKKLSNSNNSDGNGKTSIKSGSGLERNSNNNNNLQPKTASITTATTPTSTIVWTDKKALVNLHSRLLQAQARAGASELRWKGLVKKITALERYISVCAGVGTSSVSHSHSPALNNSNTHNSNNNNSIIIKIAAYLCHLWHYISTHEYIIKCQLILLKYKKYFYRFLSLCACVLSISILWSELVLSTSLHSPTGSLIGAYNINVNNISKSNKNHNNNITTDPNQAFFVQLITFITLAYMSLCTYWSLFRLNLGWAYNLQGPQQSTPSSLIFNGEYFSRLQFPLGYNFLMTINAESMKSTSFYGMMQNITLIPVFGTSFTVFVPVLMILVAVATLLNVFQRLLNVLGIETEDPVGGSLCFCCFPNSSSSSSSSRNNNSTINANSKTSSSSSSSSSKTATENNLSNDDLIKFESGRTLVRNEIKQTAMLALLQESSSSSIRGNGMMNRSASVNSETGLIYGGSNNSSSGSDNSSRGSSSVGGSSPTRSHHNMNNNHNNNNHNRHQYNYDDEEKGDKRIDDDDDDNNTTDDNSYKRFSSFYNNGNKNNNNTNIKPSPSVELQSLSRSHLQQQNQSQSQQQQPPMLSKQQQVARTSLFGSNRKTSEYQPVSIAVMDESIATTGGETAQLTATRNPLQISSGTTAITPSNHNINGGIRSKSIFDDDDDDEAVYGGGRYSHL